MLKRDLVPNYGVSIPLIAVCTIAMICACLTMVLSYSDYVNNHCSCEVVK